MSSRSIIALTLAIVCALPAVASAEEPSTREAPQTVKAFKAAYPWMAHLKEWREVSGSDTASLIALSRRFAPPEGFARVAVKPGSFQAFLRDVPLRTDRTDVRLYTGQRVSMPSAGIIPFDLGSRDVHQCADSVIRLRAEHLWAQRRASEAAFHYTSGHLARWSDWRAGRPLVVRGNTVKPGKGRKLSGYSGYRRYLESVFMYASTRSLHRDGRRVKDMKTLQAGDYFLQSGSPGHVVILLDIAEHPDGRRVALVGQGYLPARDVHVIKGAAPHAIDGVWFVLPDGKKRTTLNTPTWSPFSKAWRFK